MNVWQQLSGHITTYAPAYVMLALGLAGVSIAVSITLMTRLSAVTRPLARFGEAGDDPARAIAAIAAGIEGVEGTLADLSTKLNAHVEESRGFIRYMGLSRYDAFEEVGGNQSFSLCLLDHQQNGVIMTYLTGKNFTRSYAVTITGGRPSRELGEEEIRAMKAAVSDAAPAPVS